MPRFIFESTVACEEVRVAGTSTDRDTLSLLWRAWNPRLVRYLASRGAVSAEDLAADIWIDVARALARFEGDERAWAKWLFTIARRRLIDEARARQRRPETIGSVPELAEATDDPETVVVGRARLAEAISLIRRLPDDQSEVVLLRVVAGLDVADVADILGKQPGTVRVLAHRGLRHLAELIPPTQGGAEVGLPRLRQDVVTEGADASFVESDAGPQSPPFRSFTARPG
jgi:RNA polymerase sigma-70 factor (ECF subfamily)